MATAHQVVKLPSASERKPRKAHPPVWQGIEYSRCPPGIYDVCCIKTQGPQWLKNHRRWSIRLECNFLGEEGSVSGFLNLGDDPNGCDARRQSKYFKLWCKVNRGLPRRGQEMPWNDFIGKLFRVRIADAAKNSEGEPLPETERYSKIEEFLECMGP